jgi:hypothetical protein
MTFDELWRLNLDRKSAPVGPVDKAEAVALTAVSGENANALLLTAEDCVFLSALGIRARKNPRYSDRKWRREEMGRTANEGDLLMKMLQRFTASTVLALIMGTACFGQHYTRINLVSDTAGAARVTDPQLINPWGMSRSPSSPWWVSDQRTGFSTVYNGAGDKQSLVVAIPQADANNKNTPTGTPTGAIFNSNQADFLLAPGKPAVFLFSAIEGTIAGWNPNVAVARGAAPPSTQAVTVVKTTDGSSYTGLTSALIDGKPYLYAANFAKARVDVYDSTFHRVKLSTEDPDGDCSDYPSYCSQNAFVDGNLPRPYAPFNRSSYRQRYCRHLRHSPAGSSPLRSGRPRIRLRRYL